MYSSPIAEIARLSSVQKQQIRRNERVNNEVYNRPHIFKLIRIGRPNALEQGGVILGKLKLVTLNKIACQCIYIEFRGLAQVDFNMPSTTMVDEIQNFHKEWEFFSHKIPVYLHESRGYNFLEPGIYEFYYKVRVPIGGPCSFSTDIASVTYSIRGALFRNDVVDDVFSKNQIVYHVKAYKDLNTYVGARIGAWEEAQSRIGGFLGLFRGLVKIRVKTDKRAYIPGEEIRIVGEVINTTWRKCVFRYKLVQQSIMWGDHYFWRSDEWGSRNLKDELIMERGKVRAVNPNERIELKETLKIPVRIEPSYLGMMAQSYINELIHLEYILEFIVSVPYSTKVRLALPIIIGTEPFTYLPKPPLSASENESNSASAKHNFSSSQFSFLTKKSHHSEILEIDKKIKAAAVHADKYEPLQLPRFHLLNKEFQSKFPRTFQEPTPKMEMPPDIVELYGPPPSTISVEKNRMRKERKKHSSKCQCHCNKHKKRHKSKCHKNQGSDRTEKRISSRVAVGWEVGLGVYRMERQRGILVILGMRAEEVEAGRKEESVLKRMAEEMQDD
ncbi:Arrestin domain-containing protein 2, partial [Orchesella cincta]